jgi:hypothetical protein
MDAEAVASSSWLFTANKHLFQPESKREDQLVGEIVSIVHTPAGINPRPPDHYARVSLQEATHLLFDPNGTQ